MTQRMGYQPADLFAALGSELPEEALFTTFTFSPSTFQHEYLIPLLHRGCPEIAVLVDSIGYAQSLFSAATVQSIGTEYRLRQVPLSGAFHGKLVIVRTRHSVLLGVGSGNITSPGLQTNAEVGGLYRLEAAAQRDAVQRLISRLRPMGMLEGSTAEAVGPIDLTEEARLLTSMDSPLFEQLDPPPDVERIEIVSPFVDDNLEVVLAMCKRWPRAHIRLRMDPGFGALSDSLLALVGDRITVLVPSEAHGENARRPPVHEARQTSAVMLLRSIPGVGARTAEAVAAFIDDPQRFPNAKAVGRYFGLVPCQDQSGDRNRLGHITREGAPVVRQLVAEAAWQAQRRSPTVRAFFERAQRDDPQRKKIALVATAHYLVRVMWAMLRHGTVWQETIGQAA